MSEQQPSDWIAETDESIRERLSAATASQTQTRVTLGAMAVISAMMLVAVYNAYFSYDYRYITANQERSVGKETIPEVLMKQAVTDWSTSRVIQVSLIGIRVSVDDAAVLGTAVLAILSFWLVLVTRRENHAIGLLLRDTDSSAVDEHGSFVRGAQWLIFHTIAANALFETTYTSLAPIRTLQGPNPLVQPCRGLQRWSNKYALRFLREFFFIFPVITCVLIFIVDRYSYFIADPFNAGSVPARTRDPFFWPSLVWTFACLVPLALACRKANSFSLATQSVLRQYASKLFGDLALEDLRRSGPLALGDLATKSDRRTHAPAPAP